MQKTSHHIIFKLLTVLVVLTLLAPTVVKLGHVFEDHKHEVCLDKSTTHFHTLDLECEFYKFKVSNSLILPVSDFEITKIVFIKCSTDRQLYNFKYNHQQLSFSLRAPPILA